jgi:CRP-like cAMP-binding protein
MGTETAVDRVVEVLERVSIFQGLPRTDLERIAKLVKPRHLAAGEFLFREGDPGDKFYVVYSGAVEILKERPLGDHELLAIRRGGGAFGEMALLNDAPRSASTRAVEATQLLSVSREDFDSLLGGESLAVRLMQGLAKSLRALDVRFAARESGGGVDALRQFSRLVLRGLEPRSAPTAEGFRIAGATARDESTGGGSLWDAVATADGRTVLALIDVKGRGLPPAYRIAITRAVLHEVVSDEPFDRLLARLNSATFRNLFEGLDECVEAALIELSDGQIRWSCAGDQPGVTIRADGSTEDSPSHGPPLGILPTFEYGVATLDLQPGDTFLALSEPPAGLMRGAVDLVRGRPDAEPAELAQMLQSALGQAQARGAETDVAFVVLRKT